MSLEFVALARAHAPLLLVSLPFLGAALAAVVANARVGWFIAGLTSLVVAAIAIDMSVRTLVGSESLTRAAEGLPLEPDGFGVFGAVLVALLAAATIVSALPFVWTNKRAGVFAPSIGLCLSGAWTGALLAADFVSLFLFTETAWLCSAGLIAMFASRSRLPLNGAVRMLTFGGVAAAILLLGVALAERGLGGGAMINLASQRLAAPNVEVVGVALILVSLSWKAGLAPFNAWAAAAVTRGGGYATLVVAGLSMTAAAVVLSRVAALALPSPSISAGLGFGLSLLGVASAIVGSLQAMGATSLWRLVAYTSAAQLGCAVLGVALGSPAGLEAAFIQFAAASAAAIALLGAAFAGGVGPTMASLDGLGRRAPFAAVAMTIGALSLMGAPLTLSFLGRWRLVEAALGIGWWWVAAAGIAVSLAGSYYGGRLIERIYFRHASQTGEPADEGMRMKIALAPGVIAAVLAIVSAVEPTLLLRAVSTAAQTFADHAQ
jgi:formate hydrogenlyase subunit 3/multisubunit Na+/H+ antiporter MnhD subunit